MVDGLISTTKPGHQDGYMDQNSCQSAVMHYCHALLRGRLYARYLILTIIYKKRFYVCQLKEANNRVIRHIY